MSYDLAGRVNGIEDAHGRWFRYAFDARGRPDAVTDPNGARLIRAFDDEDRLTRRREYGPPPSGSLLHDDSVVYDARGKILYTHGLVEEDFEGYSALGTLWRSIRSNLDTLGVFNNDERFVADAMGDAVQHVSIRKDATAQSDDSVVSTYENGTGRLVATHEQQAQDTTLYTAAGERATVGVGSSDGQGNFGAERTHYYYRPDGLLIAVDHRTCSYGAPATSCVVTGSLGSLITLKGAFEDYRYDALGRRVQVRTRADTVCTGAIGSCVSSLMWVAWDGNEIADETRGAGGGMVSADSLERDLPPGDPALAPFYGTVAYLNGAAMDEPLEIQGIQPYHTWRGLIDGGDCLTGDCGVGTIDWPGLTYEANLSVIPSRQHAARSWHGSMFTEGQDDGGLMYRRNRYYDPATGQFTQEDPLGLGGGMNAYGFGSGDPVNFRDPFGLDPCRVSGNCTQTQDGLDKASAHTTRDLAARAGMQSVNAKSIKENREYYGDIQKNNDGDFTYTQGAPLGVAGGAIDTNVPNYEGYYHSHGANSHGVYDDEHFSPPDKRVGDRHGKPAYLVTPSGRMFRYDPDPNQQLQGSVSPIGTTHP